MIVFSSTGLNIAFKFFSLLMEEIDILKGRRKTTGFVICGKGPNNATLVEIMTSPFREASSKALALICLFKHTKRLNSQFINLAFNSGIVLIQKNTNKPMSK